MKIEFEQPLGFSLEVIETDDRVPSMRVNVQVLVNQFQSICRYDGNFWIQSSTWDNFIRTLNSSLQEKSTLHDINECFHLSFHRQTGKVALKWEYCKTDAGTDRQIKVEFGASIDEEVLSTIRNKFLEFPAWW